jgi:hypothetical protein
LLSLSSASSTSPKPCCHLPLQHDDISLTHSFSHLPFPSALIMTLVRFGPSGIGNQTTSSHFVIYHILIRPLRSILYAKLFETASSIGGSSHTKGENYANGLYRSLARHLHVAEDMHQEGVLSQDLFTATYDYNFMGSCLVFLLATSTGPECVDFTTSLPLAITLPTTTFGDDITIYPLRRLHGTKFMPEYTSRNPHRRTQMLAGIRKELEALTRNSPQPKK